MKNVIYFVFILLAQNYVTPDAARANLRDALTAAEGSNTQLTAAELKTVRDTQFVFIDGLFGRALKQNFLPAEEFLKDVGADSDMVILRPDEKKPLLTNAEDVHQEIIHARQGSLKKRAVIIAHSLGGVEALLTSLLHPALVTEWGVTAIVIVSAPIQGTDLGSFFDQCKTSLTTCRKLNAYVPILSDLLPEKINFLFSSLVANVAAENREALASRLFYVRTQMAARDMTSPLYPSHLFMNLKLKEPANDGLIPTASELLTVDGVTFGTDLGILEGDHNSLLNGSPLPLTYRKRKIFFKLLLKQTLLRD